MTHFIFAADSRGRGLETYIKENFCEITDFTVIVKPGGRILKLLTEIENVVKKDRENIVIFMAGICNFTVKCANVGGTKIMYKERKVDEVLSSLNILNQQLKSKNVCLKIASIAPVSLQKYQNYQGQNSHHASVLEFETELYNQQKNLEENISYINSKICEINASNLMKNIHLEKDITKISVKHRGKDSSKKKKIVKFVYNDFYDGVHPDFYLKRKWFSLLCKSSISDFVLSYVSDESEDDVETWDFKRL